MNVSNGSQALSSQWESVLRMTSDSGHGHARQAGGDSTLKLRCHGYCGLGAKSSAAVHCKGARSMAGRIVLRPEYRYQALRLKAHRCAAAGLDSGTAAERLASMPSTP